MNTEQAKYCVFIECVDPFTEEDLEQLLKNDYPKFLKKRGQRLLL